MLTNFSAPAAGATGDKASLSRASLQISKMDFTVNSIIDKINRGKVNLRPSYQREYVWTTRTASRLVESLLLNVPIPTMFFHETERGNMEVVDGKQRLTSIWAFMMARLRCMRACARALFARPKSPPLCICVY